MTKFMTKGFILSITLAIITTLLVDMFWIFREYWWHWFGIIGFVLIGIIYAKAFNN